jgi:hypothetical protein
MQCRMRKESMANMLLGGHEQRTNCRINLLRVLDTWDPAKKLVNVLESFASTTFRSRYLSDSK